MRKKKKLNQDQLSNMLHSRSRTLRRWEYGESIPTIDIVLDMSKILECEVDELFYYEEDKLNKWDNNVPQAFTHRWYYLNGREHLLPLKDIAGTCAGFRLYRQSFHIPICVVMNINLCKSSFKSILASFLKIDTDLYEFICQSL